MSERTIWVDADACPRPVAEILRRAADRVPIPVVFVANQAQAVPASPHVRTVRVAAGFDVADGYIVRHAAAPDLVVTQDIPLAAELVERGITAIDPRGDTHTPETIAERLDMRNFMENLRSSGVRTGGPPPFGMRERQAFANALDRWLARTG